MAITVSKKRVEGVAGDVGAWQEVFERSCSERVKKAIERSVTKPTICLEHARAEMEAYERYKNEPRVIQRARVFETYLRDKTIYILDDELIVGNVTSQLRASPFIGELYTKYVSEELDDPVKDYEIRGFDEYDISPEQRKEIREVVIPYFKGRTILENYVFSFADEEVKEKAFPMTASCKCIPNFGNLMVQVDSGHQTHNFAKVLTTGLKGIRDEVEWYISHLDQPFNQFRTKERIDFYNACLIELDAAMAYAKRYADMARELATKEADLKRKNELERIAEICERVPANPARNWWEAIQSVWFIEVLVYCEVVNVSNSFGRFDQYAYPFYKKSVIEENAMTRDEALELLECFFVKCNEFTELYNSDNVQVQMGFPLASVIDIGGQDKDGNDAVNDVSWLVLDAEEQVGLQHPDIAIRVFGGTPDAFLKRACEVIRLGRGKPKFIFDRKGIEMIAKAYPELSIEDWRDYVVAGCTELSLPHITMQHSFCGVTNIAKMLELALTNGKCGITNQQIGPLTGDPRTFESIEGVKQAFREQVFYWIKHLCRGVIPQMEAQAKFNHAPFVSSLLEGPLQRGMDLIEGGCWYTTYGIWMAGLADAADSLTAIDKLIYRDKKVTWDEMLEALKANWEGYEELRDLCINAVPKYGNDNDYPDSFGAWVMDIWCDAIDWVNTQKDFLPPYGGMYICSTIVATAPVGMGPATMALPSGRRHPAPLADTCSPSQGMDRKGPTAVIKSVTKLPLHRCAIGNSLNQRLAPKMLATEADLERMVAFVKTAEELGLYHIQFNVLSADFLRKAMKEPEKHRDLLVRVASYCAYFSELSKESQLDIINRTEQTSW